jgi:hypothetical protein
MLAAGGFVALTIFVGFALARHSGLAARTVLDSATHRTRLALTQEPKGLGKFPLVLLQFVGMSLTGRAVAAGLRLRFRGSLETVLVSAGLGLVAFIPWALLLGATLGLTAPAVWFTFAAFDAVGVVVLLRTTPQVLRWLNPTAAHQRTFRADVTRRIRSKQWIVTAVLTLLVVIVLYQVLLGALVPEVANDARWYHLGVPAHWVSGGRIDNSVASNSMAITGGPFYQEILYTPFLAAFGQIGAKLVNFVELLLLCLTTFALAKRITRSRDGGLCAVLVLLAIPLVTWEGTSAENDLGIVCLSAISIYAFLRWTDDIERPPWLCTAFACATAAAGMKFFGIASIVFLVIASLWVLLRQARRAEDASLSRRILRTYTAPALIVVAVGLPGLLRSAIMTGDPFFPTLTRVFPSPYWNAGNSAAVHVLPGNFFPRVLLDIVRVPWRDLVAQTHGENKHAHQWGPLLVLFLPVLLGALAFRRNRKGDLGFIFVAIAVTLAVWYPLGPGAPTRYVLPSAPLLAVAVVVVLQRALRSAAIRPLAWCAVPVVALTVVVGQPFLNGVLPGLDGDGRIQGATYYNDDYLFGSANVDDVQLRWMPAARYQQPPARLGAYLG